MVHYPNDRMRSYRRRPLQRGRFRRQHNKYHAHRFFADGYWWDSKAEYGYYELLKLEGKHFKVHPSFVILPHSRYNRVHRYTPDFVIYDDHGNVIEVDDIKGISLVPAYDHLRMDMFSRERHIPVTIVRKKHGRFVKKQRKMFKN